MRPSVSRQIVTEVQPAALVVLLNVPVVQGVQVRSVVSVELAWIRVP